jgi:glycosyltransferase involved in cell wall biosynthesis
MAYGWDLKELLRGDWDIVHAWQEPYVFSGWQISRWARNTRFVFYSFQNIAKKYLIPFNWIEHDTVARSAGWIAAGQTVADTLIARPGYRERPNCIIGLGVDTARFRSDSAARAEIYSTLGWDQNGPPVIGYLGRFIPAKGIHLLLRALSNVATPWRALFVGGGPLEQDLRNFQLRFPDCVRIVTTATHSQVPAYLNAMDIMCAPSQTTARWREQFGRMLVEAFATGLCVIASDSGEIPYVVADAAQVLPESNDIAWAAAIGELIDSPSRRKELGQRGVDRVHARFAWPVIGQAHIEFFKQLLDRGI